MINQGVVICALVFAALTAACTSVPPATEHAGSPDPARQTPEPTISPTDSASPTPAATIRSLPSGGQALAAGSYRVALDRIQVGGTQLPPAVITVPDGWYGAGWLLDRQRSGDLILGITFWNVDQVYGHPCQWHGTLFQPGPTVGDLSAALAEIPLRNATQPVDVTLDGYAGKYLEWSVPADIDFSECDTDGGVHYFESWNGFVVGTDGDRYQQAPGQSDRLWILDVDGTRLVIDAMSMPSATNEDHEELVNVVESIRFEQWIAAPVGSADGCRLYRALRTTSGMATMSRVGTGRPTSMEAVSTLIVPPMIDDSVEQPELDRQADVRAASALRDAMVRFGPSPGHRGSRARLH